MLMAMTTDLVRQILDGEDGVLYFPNSGLFENGLKIDNVMVTIPGTTFEIYWYGFLIALGMALAMIYAFTRVKKFGLEPDRFTDTVLAGFIGGIIGARAYYVIFSLDKYMTDDGTFDIVEALSIRDGGLAIYGGVIGALLFGLVVAKIRKVKIGTLLDLAGMGFLIGQCLGRWGNFFNEEAYGSMTTLPWGMTSKKIINELYFFYYPENVTIVTNRARDMIAHPCFLYESLWCLVGFIALHFYSKHRKFDGELFLLYIGWYGLGRFWIEGLRTDSLYLINNDTIQLKISQLVAGTCVIFALMILVYMYITVKKRGKLLYCDSEESKEILRVYEQKILDSKRKSGKHANDEVDEHILAEDDTSDEGGDEVSDKASGNVPGEASGEAQPDSEADTGDALSEEAPDEEAGKQESGTDGSSDDKVTG